MNLAKDGYTHDEILELLKDSKRSVKYEFSVSDKENKTIGFLTNVEQPIVSYDSTREVMGMFSASVKRCELLDINTVDERVTPWLVLKLKDKEIRFPLGRYLIDISSEYQNGQTYIDISGYDLTKSIYEAKTENRYIVETGTAYTSAIAQIIGSFSHLYNIDTSQYETSAAREWEIGTSWLTVANEMCNAINYLPIHCDECGTPGTSPYILPCDRETEIEYSVKRKSIIRDTISQSSNRFSIPNRFVRYVESTDSEYMIAIYENTDKESPYSIDNRGRTITDIESVGDAASQKELYNLAMRAAIAATEVSEQVDFYTLNMPVHNFKNCLALTCEEAGIKDKLIEYAWEMELSIGGRMLHRCNKVVTI